MKRNRRIFTIKVICIVIFSISGIHHLNSQEESLTKERLITGTVILSTHGLPLKDVTVLIKGSIIGTKTNFDGKYNIKVKDDDILVFSSFSTITKELKVGTASIINISLIEYKEYDCVNCGHNNYTVCNRNNLEKRRETRKKWLARNKLKRLKWKAERLAKREAIRSGEQERTAMGKFFYGIAKLFKNDKND